MQGTGIISIAHQSVDHANLLVVDDQVRGLCICCIEHRRGKQNSTDPHEIAPKIRHISLLQRNGKFDIIL